MSPAICSSPLGPTERAGPVPCVLLLHGWSGSKSNFWSDNNYISGGNIRRALLKEGLAVLALDAQIHGDRISQNEFAPVNPSGPPGVPPRKGYFTQREIYVQTTIDYRRALDYLKGRPEIDSARIGALRLQHGRHADLSADGRRAADQGSRRLRHPGRPGRRLAHRPAAIRPPRSALARS